MRYIIGIDLGTTNSSVSYVDTEQASPSIQMFRIPQISTPGVVDSFLTLPSFCYLTTEDEWPPHSFDLPWSKQNSFFVGRFAAEHGAKVPTRLVQSAKSWLSHSAANRREKILPPDGDEWIRMSPVEASARYLEHIKNSWNHFFAKENSAAQFEEQQIILTVPASFDEISRILTLEAAKLAGYGQLTLLEEPQAAFYNWISFHENDWSELLKPNDTILVCDVGGGTTDFSLIEVIQNEKGIELQRMFVGDHLLLGGDNMDLALAHFIEEKLDFPSFTSTQWNQVKHQAREAKELLLEGKKQSHVASIQGKGSHVIAGCFSVELHKNEIEEKLTQSFFLYSEWENASQLSKAKGLRTMGLPYEDDPNIIKHLAAFLKKSSKKEMTKPDYVLFNGGVFKAMPFQNAVMDAVRKWFPEKNVRMLDGEHLDIAVARGAAYYGKVKNGLGVRIGGGSARGYYLAIQVEGQSAAEKKVLTLLPRGVHEEATYEPNQTFLLTVNQPVLFHLFSSHVRLNDKEGDLIAFDPTEFQPMPPIQTILRFGKQQMRIDAHAKIPVHIRIRLTSIGIIELSLKSLKTEHSWKLEFQIKSASGHDDNLAALQKKRKEETFDEAFSSKALTLLSDFSESKASKLIESLEEALGMPKLSWPINVLRQMADILLKNPLLRKHSPEHESRWWNLIGFCLRPGIGYPLDDFRVKELWKILLSDQKNLPNLDLQIQKWICLRRVSCGLNKGQQAQIANEVLPFVLDKNKKIIGIKQKKETYSYSEKMRLLGSFELLNTSTKVQLGNALIYKLNSGEFCDADFWALGRLGARHLIYGSPIDVVPKDVCEGWILQLLKMVPSKLLFSVLTHLGRRVDLRDLNISLEIQKALETIFKNNEFEVDFTKSSNKEFTHNEIDSLLGDSLPIGLSISEIQNSMNESKK